MDEDNGTLMYVPKSHKLPLYEFTNINVDVPEYGKQFEAYAEYEEFLKQLVVKLLYVNPKIDVVFLSNGDIDYNETIGHHYLKNKHPDIYHEIVARLHYDRVHAKDGFSHHYFGK